MTAPGLSGLNRLSLRAIRALLSLWVRTRVLPDDPRRLGIDPERPIFFVTETRSLANLLVAEQVCLRTGLGRPTAPFFGPGLRLGHAVAAAVNLRGWWRRRPAPRVSRSLYRLIEAARAAPAFDVQLVPVAVFFGRRPDRENSLLKLLLSDNSIHIGRLRKTLMVLLQGRDTWVQFGAPVALQAFIGQSAGLDGERAARKLSRLFRAHFRQQRDAAVGPDLSALRGLIVQVLRERSVRAAVVEDAGGAQSSPRARARSRARARRYAYEIAADFSYPFIIFMRRLLRRLWDRLYDGVDVNHVQTLQQLAPGHTLVYLPCHRSHIDYLLLSYVLHAHGLAIPKIAAGINLNLPLIGPLLRRGGAFFLRRSFRGKPLYAAVFQAYLSVIIAKGFSVEYFIEGGRSRSGLSLTPRPGMLAMTVRGYLAERRRPLLFVPVYIGYEKLVEGASFEAELGGAKKKKESLFGLLKGLRALRSEFGKVHVNIGEPLALDALLDRRRPDWRDAPVPLGERPGWLPALIDELAAEAITRINAAVDVNPVNLLALALLAAPRAALGEDDLLELLTLYRTLLEAVPYGPRATLTALTPAHIVAHGLRLGVVARRRHPLGDVICAAPGLRYFFNNALHAVALPALVASCFQHVDEMPRRRFDGLCRLAYLALRGQLFLRWSEHDVDAALGRCVDALIARGLLTRVGDRLARADGGERRLALLARPVLDSVERFALALALLTSRGSGVLGADQLTETCRLLAERLALLYAARPSEFADPRLYAKLLEPLQAAGLLWIEDGRLAFDRRLGERYQDVSLMLPEGYRADLRRLLAADRVARQAAAGAAARR